MNVKEMRWIRRALLMAAAMIMMGATASAELVEPDSPNGHIAKTLVIDGVEVTVDADVYGSDVREVQAYRVEGLNLGSEPEKKVDLSTWLGEDKIVYQREEDLFFETENGTRLWLASYSDCELRSENYNRLQAESFDWGDATSFYPEHLRIDELEGMSVEEGLQKLLPTLEQLGITAVCEPFDGIAIDLDRLNAATQRHIDYGVAPDETVVEDWTREDEHYRVRLAIRYRGLPVMPWSAYGKEFMRTPEAYFYAWISRRGVEHFRMEFVPGEDEALEEAFVPITAEEALARCAEQAKSRFSEWGFAGPTYSGVEHAHVSSMHLGYALIPESGDAQDRGIGMYTSYCAKPVWYFSIYFDTTAMQAVSIEQPEPHAEAMSVMQVVAIDAKTGEMLLDF